MINSKYGTVSDLTDGHAAGKLGLIVMAGAWQAIAVVMRSV